jgi:SAM-dependent methyltransferase
MKHTTFDPLIEELRPSALVRRFASQIVCASSGKPILDIACGAGRNAFVFSSLGCSVICVDKDLAGIRAQQLRLSHTSLSHASAKLSLYQMDLFNDPWPFGVSMAGGLVNVHFLLSSLFPSFERSIFPGGYLLLETVPGCGGNYLQLPKAGELRAAFERSFDLEFYKERKVGPASFDAVTVQLLGRRKDNSM